MPLFGAAGCGGGGVITLFGGKDLHSDAGQVSRTVKEDGPFHAGEQILGRLKGFGYINDEQFARSWVESRRLLKPMSKRRLRLELKQKHVADEIIGRVLEDDETSDRETLRLLVGKKRKQSRYQDDMKLMQYLVRQGYGYDDVKAAMRGEADEL